MKSYCNLSTLIEKLKKYYHPKKHNLSKMADHVRNYCGTDWKKYVKFSPKKYNRISLTKTHDFEIILICWKKGQSAPIHNHPAKGCLLKILTGQLKETLFKKRRGKLYKIRTDIRRKNQVSYMDDTRGFHDVAVLQNTVSLHIYSPPNYKPQFL
jgi:cysteine dioxygenase